jgi:WD40 repeat protein
MARSTMREVVQTAELTTQVLAFEPVSGCLVVAGLDGVCRFDVSAEDRSVLIPPTGGDWTSIDISPQGMLAAGSGNGKIVLFDLARRSVLAEWELPEARRTRFLRFSADGTRLAAVGWEQRRRVEWFDVPAMKRLSAVGVDGDVDYMARSPDGRTILLSVENDLLMMDPQTRRVVGQLAGHATTLTSIASSPVEPLVATVGRDRRLILHDMAAGRQVFSSVAGMDDLHTACFSPDGRTLATGGINGSVKLWHVSTRQPLVELSLGNVEELVFSPDGRRLAVRVTDGPVFLSGLQASAPGSPNSLDRMARSRRQTD